MKKILIGLFAAAMLTACNNASESTEEKKDSLDSLASEKKEMIDSTTEEKKEAIDSLENKVEDAKDTTGANN